MIDVGDSFDRAIELLSSDDSAEKLSRRISAIEGELLRLKKLQKALHGTAISRKQPTSLDAALESKIVELVKKKGPLTPKAIAEVIGVTYMVVGKTVRASDKLTKNGAEVVLAV